MGLWFDMTDVIHFKYTSFLFQTRITHQPPLLVGTATQGSSLTKQSSPLQYYWTTSVIVPTIFLVRVGPIRLWFVISGQPWTRRQSRRIASRFQPKSMLASWFRRARPTCGRWFQCVFNQVMPTNNYIVRILDFRMHS